MLLRLALVVLVGWPFAAAAQPLPLPGGVAPLPEIGLPLPRIGLPLPQIGLPPATNPPPAPVQPRHVNGGSRRGDHRRSDAGFLYVVPAFGWPYPLFIPPGTATPGVTAQPEKQEPANPPMGRLKLDVTPAAVLQLYVDGYYIGTSDDFNDELRLEAGPHSLEIRAAGYETLVVEVNVAPHRSITYRGRLMAAEAKPAADQPAATAAPPATPMVIYVVPGCYIGNVPPEDARLPATCDPSRAKTIRQ
jgi:hypothetical protein